MMITFLTNCWRLWVNGSLQGAEVVRTPDGYAGRQALIADGDRVLFPIDDLYEIEIVADADGALQDRTNFPERSGDSRG